VDATKANDAGQNYGFESVAAHGGTTNVVNILGAIAPGKNSTADAGTGIVAGSSLTVDSSWIANAYGPVEGLANITVKGDGSTLNLFSNAAQIGGITLNGSTLNLFGKATQIGGITLDGGTVRVGSRSDERLNSAISNIAANLEYTDPATGKVYKGSAGNVVINVDAAYPWKGNDDQSNSGELFLDGLAITGASGTLEFAAGGTFAVSARYENAGFWINNGDLLNLNSST
jgi:hypothetical protein